MGQLMPLRYAGKVDVSVRLREFPLYQPYITGVSLLILNSGI